MDDSAFATVSNCRNFTVNCSFVNLKLVDQMKTWSGGDCGSGEKCMYKVNACVQWAFLLQRVESKIVV